MSEASIYPIQQLYFQCDGCKARWMVRPDSPLHNIEEFKGFMDGGRMGPCPRNCGSRTCSAAFKIPGPGLPGERPADPFTMFDAAPPASEHGGRDG